jgi:excisionase family DNA binding protein
VGNLNDYVKFQMAQGMEKGGGAGGVAAEMAVGLAMAQQLMQQQGGGGTPPPIPGMPVVPATAAAPSPAGLAVDVLTPADVAKALGVSEEDVLASIQSGDLKAKKIGTAYRITRAAFDEFMKG